MSKKRRYMEYDYGGFPPYVSVAERKAQAAKLVAKLKKKDKHIRPVIVKSKIKIAHTFWGMAWCKNIETYRDMDYRLERGRSYVRTGAIVDLRISEKKVVAQVSGANLYQVSIDFKPLSKASWRRFVSKCSDEIASLVDLLGGKVPSKVSQLITDHKHGLFPTSNEIQFDCNCPDYANCCKHIAAALYGIGVHFDADPMLFFLLRGQDPKDLITKASKDISQAGKQLESTSEMEDLFGIEIADSPREKTPEKKLATKKKKSTTKKKSKTKKETSKKALIIKKRTTKKTTRKKVTKKKKK